jgi:hypothetical protein
MGTIDRPTGLELATGAADDEASAGASCGAVAAGTVDASGGAIVSVTAGGVMVMMVGIAIPASAASEAGAEALADAAGADDGPPVMANVSVPGLCDGAAEELTAATVPGSTSGNVSPLLGAGRADDEDGRG